MKLKQPAQERNKEFFLMVQTLFNQASLIVETNLFNYNLPSALDDLNKCEKFRSRTARMNTEGQSCLLDLIDTDQNQLAGCCGFIRVNRIEKEAQLVVIFYEQYIDYIEESIAYILKVLRTSKYALNVLTCNVSGLCVTKETLGILERLNFYDATDELQREGDNHPCYMRFVVDESVRPGRRGDDQSSATGSVGEICRFWARGYCRFGEDCRYLHISAVPSGSLALTGSVISQPGTPALFSLGPPPSSPALSSLPGTGTMGTVQSAVPAIFMPVSAVPGAGGVMGVNGSPLGGVRSNMLPPFYPTAAYAPDTSGGFESPQFAFPQYPYASYSFPSFPYASYPWQQQMLGGSAGGSGIAGGGDSAGGVMTPSSGFTQQQPAVYAPAQMMYGYSTVPGQQLMQSQPFQQPPQMHGQREDSAAAGAASAMMYPSTQMMSLIAQQQAQQQAQAQVQAQGQGQQGQGQTVGVAQPSDYMFYPSAPPPPYPYTNSALAPQPQPPQQQGQEADEEAPRQQDSSFSSCSTDNPYYDAVEPPASTFPPGYPVGGYPGVNYPYPQYSQRPAAASYPSSIDGTEEHNVSQLSFSQSVSQSFSRSQDQDQEQEQRDAGPSLMPDSSQNSSFDSGPQEKANATAVNMRGAQQKHSNDGGSDRGGVGNNNGASKDKQSARAEATQMAAPRAHSDDQSAATVVTGHVRTVKTSPAPLAPPSIPAATTAATSTAAIAGMHQKLLDLVNTAPPSVLARLRYNEQHVLSFEPPLASAAPATSTQEPNRAEPPQNSHLDLCDRGQQQMDNSAGKSHYLTAQDLQSLNDYYQRMLNPAQYHNRFERIFTHGHFNLGAHHSDGVGDASRSDTQEATESSVTIHATPRAPDADNHSTISSQTSSSPSEEYASELGFEVHDATSEDFNSNFHQYQDMSPPDQPEGTWRERCEKGLSGRALSRQVQRRETAHRHHRLRYLLRALQMHRPRGPLNPADVIDLISPFCESAAGPARQGTESGDNACVIDLTDLVALSMQEPHERRLHKKPGDTRSTAMELDLSTPSLAGSRRSAVASAQDATNGNGIGDGDGYESDEEEGDGDGQSVLTQPATYSGTTVAKAETKGKLDGAQASHNLTQSTSQGGSSSSVEGKPAGRSFAIRQFTPAMVQCVVNGRAQNGPWPSLPSLLNAMGLSSAQWSVESLLFLNAGVVQAYCAEKSNITAQFRRLHMQQGQQMSSQGQREDLQQRESHAAQGSQDSRQPIVPPQQAQMSASMQQLQQRLLAQQQIFHQQQRQLQQQQQTPVGQVPEPSYQQIPVTGDPPPQPIAMPPGGVHPQHLQYWMQQQQQVYMQQFFMQQQAQAAAGAEAAVETSGSALSVANTGGAYAQRQPPQPPMQREEPPTESPPAATAPAGASYGPPERLRPPPIQIIPHSASVPAPVVPPRAQFAPQSYPQYAPQRPQYPQNSAGMSVVTQGHSQGRAQAQGPQGHSAAPSERQYNIRSTLAQQQQQQQQQQQPALRQPQEQERVTTSAGASSRPPPIYPRAAAQAPTSTAGPAPPARLSALETRSNRTNGTSSEPDSASQQQLKQPTKKRKPRKAPRDGSGVSVSGGSSGQESPSPFPRAYPTYPAAAATTGMEQRQGQQQGGGQQRQQQEQQLYYVQGSQGQPSQGLGQGQVQSLRKQQPAAAAVPVPVHRPPAPQTQQGEKRA